MTLVTVKKASPPPTKVDVCVFVTVVVASVMTVVSQQVSVERGSASPADVGGSWGRA